VVHPFETRLPTPASNFPLEVPALELLHRAFDVEFFAHSGVVDVLLEARNLAWVALMQADMIVTRMACDQSDQIRSLHAKKASIGHCENPGPGP
jgi:hypothetical protein